MRHALVELDVSLPLETLDVDGRTEGVGLLLRDGRRPLGFLLLEPPVGRLEKDLLEDLVVHVAAAGSPGSCPSHRPVCSSGRGCRDTRGRRPAAPRSRVRGRLPFDPAVPARPPPRRVDLLEPAVWDRQAVFRRLPAPPGAARTAAVVVCTRNRADSLRERLRSIAALARRPDESVVVDNGDDAQVHPEWLGWMLAGLRAPEVMAVTGLVLPPCSRRRRSCVRGRARRVRTWRGRVELRRKGRDVLVWAWRELCDRAPDAELHLVIVRTGQDDELGSLLAAPGVRGVSWLADYAAPEQVRERLAACDLWISASRHEGFAVAPLGAMASGRAAVLSDAPGVAELVSASESSGATVVPRGAAQALASALLEALLARPDLDRRGDAPRRRVQEVCSVAAVSRQFPAALRAGPAQGAA